MTPLLPLSVMLARFLPDFLLAETKCIIKSHYYFPISLILYVMKEPLPYSSSK